MSATEHWTLTINDQQVELPADYVLVRRAVFDRIAKAFDYIEGTITKHGVDPERRDDHGLIHARVEARDDAAFCRDAARSEGTTAIYEAPDG